MAKNKLTHYSEVKQGKVYRLFKVILVIYFISTAIAIKPFLKNYCSIKNSWMLDQFLVNIVEKIGCFWTAIFITIADLFILYLIYRIILYIVYGKIDYSKPQLSPKKEWNKTDL